MEHIVILGNGIAGVTAARHIRKLSNKKITIISAETEYFFSRTALMYIYMGHMKYEHTKPYEDWFWDKNRIDLLQAYVSDIDFEKQELKTDQGDTIAYDKLILAVGSTPNKFGWPGQDLKGVQGLYSKQDLDKLEKYAPDNETCKQAVIVGGGLIGIELAEMLHTRHIPVTFIVREESFWNGVLPPGESAMINEEIRSVGIDLRLGVNLEEIIDDGTGKVRAIRIKETGEEIACDLVGLTAGVRPNVDFLKDTALEMDKGILVDRQLQTNIENVYAIGDCSQQRTPPAGHRAIEAVWYAGRMMGETVAQTICDNPMDYNPGHWFNSAKFIDIEYQTYGLVNSARNLPDYEKQFHWRHPEKRICITMAYHKEDRKFLGINTFGIRLRHEIFNRWLNENRSIDYVMEYLRDANFDPEFYKNFEPDILSAYNQDMNTSITLKKSSRKRIFKKKTA